ncbi:MAG: hypothetical protein QF704_11695, partial [Anaerolineales bacterium]|nr:hypothetical protein [Anaerolineales bacterium]
RSITTPVTEADGDGTYISEEWQIEGAGVATYTFTQTTYDDDASDNTGSDTFIECDIDSYTSGDFYLYQRRSGARYLRKHQLNDICLSLSATSELSDPFKVQFEIYFYFDTGNASYMGNVMEIQPGDNFIYSKIRTNKLAGETIGASPYIEFRLHFLTTVASSTIINLRYIKGEFSNHATPLYIDQGLEQTRIDNA